MLPLLYTIYLMELKNKISPKTMLELAASNKFIHMDIQTRIGLTLPFVGSESEYVRYLLDTALMYYLFRNPSQLADIELIQDQDVLDFVKRYAIDRVS